MPSKGTFRKKPLAIALAMLTTVAMPTFAGEITALDLTVGDGFIFSDATEEVFPPGVKAVTGAPNNDDYTSPNGFAPQGVENCLMSNRPPDVNCDAEAGSGKRIKNRLTGFGAFDTVYNVTPTGGTTEYFTYGKLTNLTPARLTGFKVIVGTGTGDDFVPISQTEEPLSMDQVAALTSAQALNWPGNGGVDGQNPLQRAWFPDGLYGGGGQEGETGYFETESSGFIFIPEGTDTLTTNGMFGGYSALFGAGLLSSSQLPNGLFFDGDGDPATEAELLYWQAGDLWLDGNGVVQDAATIEALLADPAAYVDSIDDLAGVNLNYSIDVGDISTGKFTVRYVPLFSPIVTAAQSDYQLGVALALDQTEIPYLFLDQTTAAGEIPTTTQTYADFQEVIGAFEALPTSAARSQALERAGTSYLRNFGMQAQLLSRDHVEQVLQHIDSQRGATSAAPAVAGQFGPDNIRVASTTNSAEQLAMSLSQSGSNSRAVSERLSVFVSGSASTGKFDRTTNGAGSDFDGYSLTAGADYRVQDNLRVGGALSYGQNEASIDDNRGKLEADGVSLLAYGSYGAQTGAYADAVAGYSWLDYDNKRNIAIGNYVRQADSSTDGRQVNIALKGGYNFDLGGVIAGPSVQFQYYDLKVDGYKESGAGVLNMSVEDMDFKSKTVWLGGQARMPLKLKSGGDLEVRGSLHWVKELEDGGFGVATRFTDGVLPFVTPVDDRDSDYLRAGLGMAGNFKTQGGRPVTVGLDYQQTFGNSDYREHRATLNVEMRF